MPELPEDTGAITYRKHVKPRVDEYIEVLKRAQLFTRKNISGLYLHPISTIKEGERTFQINENGINEARKWGADPDNIRENAYVANTRRFKVGGAQIKEPAREQEIIQQLRLLGQQLRQAHEKLTARMGELQKIQDGIYNPFVKGKDDYDRLLAFRKRRKEIEEKIKHITVGTASPIFLQALISHLEKPGR